MITETAVTTAKKRLFILSVLAMLLAVSAIAFVVADSDDSEAAGEPVITFNPNVIEATDGVFDGNDQPRSPFSTIISSPVYVPDDDFYLGDETNINRIKYIRTGFTFLGWSDVQQDPMSEDYEPHVDYYEGSLIASSNTDKTVYAVWEINSYPVRLVYSDFDGESYYRTIYLPYGRELQDLSSYMGYVPEGMEGYKVVGWCTVEMPGTKDGNGAYIMPTGGIRYSQTAKLDKDAGLTILYALWGKRYDLVSNTPTTIDNGTGCYYVTSNGNTYNSGALTVSRGTPYIYIESVSLIFSNIVNNRTVVYTGQSPFVISNNANVELTVMDNCTFYGGRANSDQGNNHYNIGYAGINVQNGTTLTISQYSEGILDARGGDGFNSYYRANGNTYNQRNGYPGSGIGANGSPGTNNDCGNIIINGGTVTSRGGDMIVDYDATNRWGSRNDSGGDMTSGAGIGGKNATVTINGGNTTATSGNVHGQYGDNCSSTYIVNSGNENDPIKTRTNGKTINGGTVTEINAERAKTNAPVLVTLRVTSVDGSTSARIGNATGVSINGTTIYLGGMSISSGTEILFSEDLVGSSHPNFEIILTTGHDNFYKGTATWNGSRYNVPLVENNNVPHGMVKVYLNETEVSGSEVFATITPMDDTSISGTTGQNRVLFPFELTISDGYSLVGMKSSTDGTNWTDRELQAGESISTGDIIIVKLYMTLVTGQSTYNNYISFTIEPVSYDITISVFNNEDDSFRFNYEMVTTDDNNPEGIQWTNGYTDGTQRAFYKSGKTYVFHTSYGSNNPFNLLLVTMNGENVYPVNNGDGTFILEISDISNDIDLEVHYRPLMLIKAYDPTVKGGAGTTESKIKLVYENGAEIPLIPGQYGVTIPVDGEGKYLPRQGRGSDSGGAYTYAYVNRNDPVYFMVADYTTISGDTPARIQSISVSLGSTTYLIASALDEDHIYTINNAPEDASIHVVLSATIFDITCISGTTTTLIPTFEGSYITLPTAADLLNMISTTQGDMYVKTGYELLRWESPSGYSLLPGSKFNVYAAETFTAVWDDDPEEYTITYVLNGGTNSGSNIGIYTIETETFQIYPATKYGYVCTWSVDGASPVDTPTITPGTADGQYHRDFTVTAVWTPANVMVRYNQNLDSSIRTVSLPTDGYKPYGSAYGQLPNYENFTYNNQSYSFGGWSLDAAGSQKISSKTIINTTTEHTLYIIWIINSGEYVINLVYNSNQGFAYLSSITGSEHQTITLTIQPAHGYYSASVKVNGSPLDTFHERDTTATFELTGSNRFFTVEVGFAAETYDITVVKPYLLTGEVSIGTRIIDGVTYYIVNRGTYSINSDPVYITKPAGNSYPNHSFYGWTGTDISGTERNLIEIDTGSYGDREYTEIWVPNTYSITYHLDGGTTSNPTLWDIGTELPLTNAAKANMRFEGWYYGDSYDPTKKIENGILPATITSDIDLYAHFIDSLGVPFPFTTYGTADDVNKTLTITLNNNEYTYNGDLQIVLQELYVGNKRAYSINGTSEHTYAGTFTFRVTLEEGFIWGTIGGSPFNPNYATYDIIVNWTMSQRTVFITTNSIEHIYDGQSVTVPQDAFSTLGMIAADLNNPSRFLITLASTSYQNVGEYLISPTIDNTKEAYGSYNIILLLGNVIIFADDSTTFIVTVSADRIDPDAGMGAPAPSLLTLPPYAPPPETVSIMALPSSTRRSQI